ncbi:MAG: peptidylprolyl isomerase [Bacteroidales bacterium]|nr:peptidylprolyl isomerase [Bacteroidales bacterium]
MKTSHTKILLLLITILLMALLGKVSAQNKTPQKQQRGAPSTSSVLPQDTSANTIKENLAVERPQGVLLDKVVAVVGKQIIMYSDIEVQYQQYRQMGSYQGSEETVKCSILEGMILSKLLMTKADNDSLYVPDNQIDMELDYRLKYFISQIGSQEKLEEYFGKSISEIRSEMREGIVEQKRTEMARNEVVKNTIVTPSEVRKMFKALPIDSVPMVNSEVVIQQLIKQPEVGIEQTIEIKERLRGYRQRILNGEKFSTLAILYSEDPGSAAKGGELGFYGKGELYPEFEKTAFKLSPGEISDVVETKAGFHIIQMIDRRGEFINVRHILLRPKVSFELLQQTSDELDSLATEIRSGKITFDEAVTRYSDDNKTTGGFLINPANSSTKWELSQLDPTILYSVDKMQPGDISQPLLYDTEDGYQAYRILFLKSKSTPHRANIEEDYDRIQEWAIEQKKHKKLEEWMHKQYERTYIRIADPFDQCAFEFSAE